MLLSTAYLPPIAWFSCLARHDCLVDLSGNYQKQSFRNRTTILTSRGLLDLVIPVRHQGKQTMLGTEISYREQWVRRHVRSIETAYRNAPYFDFYWPEIAAVIRQSPPLLHSLNNELISLICRFCEVKMPGMQLQWQDVPEGLTDWRESIHPKRHSGVSTGRYFQLFPLQTDDPARISILDLLFNKGPESSIFLIRQTGLQPSNQS